MHIMLLFIVLSNILHKNPYVIKNTWEIYLLGPTIYTIDFKPSMPVSVQCADL